MDFRGKFSIPQPEEIPLESSWMPATPKKPPILVRSNSVLESPNGNLVPGGMANWIEPASNNNCFAEIFNTNPQADQIPARFGCDGNPNANGIAGSYQQQSLLDEGVDWNNISFMQLLQEGDNPDLAASTNRTLTGDVQAAAERPLMPIQRPEMSNFRGDCSSSGGLSSDAFPRASRPSYDLNSSLSINSHAHANVANSLVFTPEQAANMGEAIQHGDELLQNIVDSSSTAISTPQKEKTDPDKKVDLGIDLNKTPQQKPPKRKKHRPKVIVEGKPKRTRKPVQPKNTVSGENLPAKRKYVRKNKPKNLTAQEVDVTGETRDPGTGTAQKTCKRVLIFDMEKTGDETHDNVVAQQEVQNMNKSTTSMAGNYQPTGLGNGTNQACGMMRSAESGLPKSLMVENQIPGQMSSDTHFTRTPPDRQAALAPLASTQDQQLRNFYVAGRPWKGSVVDSVIGVFLTQNVSDHLSSSAFMSLAARFPLKSRTYSTKDKAETNIIDRQAPISILNPDDTFKWREVFGEPINNPNIASHQSENQWGSDIRGTERTLTEAQSQTLDEEFVLSQDSFDSTITQVASGIRSCSGSNSETEDPCTSCKPSSVQLSSSSHCLQMEKMTSVHEVCGLVNGCTELNEKSKHGLVEYDQLKLRYDAMKHLDFPSSTYSDSPEYLYMQSAGPATSNKLHIINDSRVPELCCFETFSEESTSSWHSTASRSAKGPEAVSKSSRTGEPAGSFGNSTKELNGECRSREARTADPYPSLSMHLTNQQHIPQPAPDIGQNHQYNCSSYQHERNNMFHLEGASSTEPVRLDEAHTKMKNATTENVPKFNKLTEKTFEAVESISATNTKKHAENRLAETNLKEQTSSHHASVAANTKNSKGKKGNSESQNWDNLRKQVESNGRKRERGNHSMDSLDYEALRKANVNVISDAIKERGMNNMLAERIQEFLNRLVREHGSIDLEWLRDVPPDQAKNYLLSIRGLGLKSVECVRLLTLHHLAFPVDTNVGRIAVRLGWVPLQPLPESLQLHLLELYPMLESIQKYLWPRLCKLDQRTLYELHYQMITFGKVFCTKSKPNCNACPMRGECRHFASAFASARLALPGPEERGIVSSTVPIPTEHPPAVVIHPMALPPPENDLNKEVGSKTGNCEPIIEEPATPELECTEISQSDIEDAFYEDPDEIPTIKLNMEEFTENLQTYMQKNMELQEGDMSKALVALTDVASIPIPKLKNVSRLRTEHQVYELPDSHPLLERLDRREPDDPSPYLLAIWTPGETANSIQPSERSCGSQEPGKLCNDETCFSCNSMREANSQTVRGTILIPCRTAMRGSFPLNGTYFQVNEMFADHDSSLNPIDVPREWIWNLPRRTVYFGTSVTTIFRGLSTEGIQYCFWKGFVCVRGFDLTTRAPRPLMARLHFPASKLAKAKNDDKR